MYFLWSLFSKVNPKPPDPSGYVGYGQGGELTEPVRRRPHSLIIVDSADAAHPEVQELLAQVQSLHYQTPKNTGPMAAEMVFGSPPKVIGLLPVYSLLQV